MSDSRKRNLIAGGPVDVQGRRGEVSRTKGYSMAELRRAGMTIARAAELGLPLDGGRKTGIGANVLRLREILLG